jgi:hypothetical protein
LDCIRSTTEAYYCKNQEQGKRQRTTTINWIFLFRTKQ